MAAGKNVVENSFSIAGGVSVPSMQLELCDLR